MLYVSRAAVGVARRGPRAARRYAVFFLLLIGFAASESVSAQECPLGPIPNIDLLDSRYVMLCGHCLDQSTPTPVGTLPDLLTPTATATITLTPSATLTPSLPTPTPRPEFNHLRDEYYTLDIGQYDVAPGFRSVVSVPPLSSMYPQNWAVVGLIWEFYHDGTVSNDILGDISVGLDSQHGSNQNLWNAGKTPVAPIGCATAEVYTGSFDDICDQFYPGPDIFHYDHHIDMVPRTNTQDIKFAFWMDYSNDPPFPTPIPPYTHFFMHAWLLVRDMDYPYEPLSTPTATSTNTPLGSTIWVLDLGAPKHSDSTNIFTYLDVPAGNNLVAVAWTSSNAKNYAAGQSTDTNCPPCVGYTNWKPGGGFDSLWVSPQANGFYATVYYGGRNAHSIVNSVMPGTWTINNAIGNPMFQSTSTPITGPTKIAGRLTFTAPAPSSVNFYAIFEGIPQPTPTPTPTFTTTPHTPTSTLGGPIETFTPTYTMTPTSTLPTTAQPGDDNYCAAWDFRRTPTPAGSATMTPFPHQETSTALALTATANNDPASATAAAATNDAVATQTAISTAMTSTAAAGTRQAGTGVWGSATPAAAGTQTAIASSDSWEVESRATAAAFQTLIWGTAVAGGGPDSIAADGAWPTLGPSEYSFGDGLNGNPVDGARTPGVGMDGFGLNFGLDFSLSKRTGACRTIIPEIDRDILGKSLKVEKVIVCVEYVQFPGISLLGFRIPIELFLLPLVMSLFRMVWKL